MVIENKDKKKDRTASRVVRNTAQDTIPYLEQYENGLYLIDREKGLGRYAFRAPRNCRRLLDAC